MIQPIKCNSNGFFQGSKLNSIKEKGIGIIKDVNKVANTTQGVIRGTAEGIGMAAIVGLIGKNIKNANANIFKTTKGIAKDAGSAVINTAKFIPSVITKSPLENAKTLAKLPKNFYTNYLKGNKTAAITASVAGLAVLALRTIQGVISGNLSNATIDHATNTKH